MNSQRKAAKSSELPVDSSAFYKLARVVNLAARPFVATLSKRYNISLTEWRAMVALASNPGVAAHDVVNLTGLDKMSISRALTGLTRSGHLIRMPDQRDARRTLLCLSDSGYDVFNSVDAHAKGREKTMFSKLQAHEQKDLNKIIDKMIEALLSDEDE